MIVLALDRLGRRTRIVLDLVERFTAAGVKLVCDKRSVYQGAQRGTSEARWPALV